MSLWRWVPQTNKFEQVSSDHHQMSLAEGESGLGEPYNEIQCIIGNGHMGTPGQNG